MDAQKNDPRMIPREKDEKNASPLGRGADPGASVDAGPARADGIGRQGGHQSANARGGTEGTLHRENEDAVQEARD